MTYPVRGYVGAASAGTLSASLSASATGSVASSTSIASWNSSSTVTLTSGVTITVAIDYGLATEEKVLAYYVDSTHINITARGVDGTTAQTHGAGAFFIPVWSAAEAQEAQNAVQLLKPVLTNTGGATTPAVIGVDATAAVGTAQVVAPIDHVHDLPSTSLATWLQGATVTASNLSVPAANLTGTLTVAQLANASNTWNVTGTTASSAITGYTNYLILLSAYGHTTATTGSGAYFSASLSATTTTGTVSQTTGIAYTINWAGANFVSTSGFQAITASATTASFTLQIVPNSNNASGGSYYAIVIGLA